MSVASLKDDVCWMVLLGLVSPPSCADVKNAWSYTSIPPYVFMTWCLVKYRGNFTFNLVLEVLTDLVNDKVRYRTSLPR
jgi:hypothetical protein